MNVKRGLSAVTFVSTLWGLIGVSVRKDTSWQGMAKHAEVCACVKCMVCLIYKRMLAAEFIPTHAHCIIGICVHRYQ